MVEPLVERHFEDTSEGDVLGPERYGPMTIMHLVRWASALENWHRIHYDTPFCVDHEGLPGPVVNGTWKQQTIAQLLKEWAGRRGWVRDIRFEFRGIDLVGEVLSVQGRVVGRAASSAFGEARCALEVVNSSGVATTVGEATVVLPRDGGPDLPYPFPRATTDDDEPGASRAPGRRCPPELEQYVGVESERLVSPDAIDASALRRFAQAIMSRDPDYSEAADPRTRRFGTVVAPPLYPLHALHVPADAPDPLEKARYDEGFDGASQTPWSTFGLPELAGAPKRILNGGNRVVLCSYAPLGSHVAVTSCYEDIYQKEGKSGSLLFLVVRSDFAVHETGQSLLTSWQTTILR